MGAARRGGPDALEALLPQPLPPAELAALGDDRWLSIMTRCVFNAGFNWKVIEAKWPGFEEAFDGFDTGRCAMLSDDDIDRLLKDKRVVRHARKLMSVRENAVFLQGLAAEHGAAGRHLAAWPATDHVGLLDLLKARGSRLGGSTGQYAVRFIGKDSFILSRDVCAALVREGVVDKTPSSRRDMAAVQAAFNRWMDESGRGLTQISRTLAMSVG
ncbi:MAG: DNA-3-methyladenine glycosylase I [Alphaproteobacteria bacterium]